MTPAERQLIAGLFDRLATLEDAQRDPEAERAINDGLRQAPNAIYSLVQTSLIQEEALKQADARIRQLEQAASAQTQSQTRSGSFLGMGDGPFGRADDRRGSVPNTRSAETPMSAPPSGGFQTSPQPMPAGPAPGPAPQPQQGGGSFLGTAAAAAAGAIGGGLLMNAIRGMSGGGRPPEGGGFGFGNPAQAGERGGGGLPWGGGAGGPGGPGGGAPGGAGPGGGLPWGNSGGGAGGGALSREAGINDIGRSGGAGGGTAGQGGGRDALGSSEAKRGGDNESSDRGEGGERGYDTASAEHPEDDEYESAEDADHEDDDYEDDAGDDDADFGDDDGGDTGGDDGGGDGGDH